MSGASGRGGFREYDSPGSRKFDDGVEHRQRAEKALKTSVFLLKFSPDYDIAALEYKAAAECFQEDRSEQALAQALHCWQKVVEIRDKQQDAFGTARALEQMAVLLSTSQPGQLKVDFSEVIRLQREAAHRYRLGGKGDAAVRVLQKAAKFKEENENDGRGAAEILSECVSIHEEDEKWHYASEVYRDLISLLARERMHAELLQALDRHVKVLHRLGQQNGIYKAAMSKVIVCLTMDDPVRADNALSDEVAFASNFLGSREFHLAAETVDAYKAGDSQALAAALQNQMWSFLPTEIVNMVRDLNAACRGANSQGRLSSCGTLAGPPSLVPATASAIPNSPSGLELTHGPCPFSRGFSSSRVKDQDCPVVEGGNPSILEPAHATPQSTPQVPADADATAVSIEELLC
ncbi:gi20748, related [Neospora caninum Liverpool]|uniref:Gamma-soluble NSF attachment protein n=1 Tax=Neospora caninum (strain Liverpool) TaxID=572307 RepID=F0VA01_NEOCL|nr:gi20748, related [Neospora caninum Liverpool]CBZ50490.1 gi20748, related [Neospora caninum Liverpool]CEL65100.1 TPA: GI20748, related [Neospora caninum Liverpool]|eukprot:XP_003880523.1 gi20748, related [Neospora caninum Liverpool]